MSAAVNPGRVLVVDDSTLLLGIVSNGLSSHGWQVETADSGLAGLAAAKRRAPDAVVCDLHMPEMDGYQVLRAMRHIDPTLPVVVHSGQDDLASVLRAVREGAFDYVLKADKDIRPLLAALDRAMAHVRLMRENARLQAELSQRLVEIEAERQKSERLLLNVLPAPVAARLKAEPGKILADRFPEVSVLFADIVDFTPMSRTKSPESLVELLNDIFSVFDRLAERHAVEKIKTIGDAWMAAAGLPTPRPDHAEACAELALDMMGELKKYKAKTGETLGVRIGIHTGPVIAGVIGETKFGYDLWGETVNIASRMESRGLPGQIQVTETTAERLKDRYRLVERGPVEVKGVGTMTTWLLERRLRMEDRRKPTR